MKIQITSPLFHRDHCQNAVLLAFLMLLIGSGLATAQTLFQDSFSYNSGTVLAGQGGWTASPSGSAIDVSSGSLSIAGLAPSGGNSVALTENNNASGVVHSFAAQTTGNVYQSFLLNVTSEGALTTSGAAIGGFIDSQGQEVGSIWLRADNTGLDIGGTVDSSTPVEWNSPNTGFGWALGTYLIVEQIQFPRADNTADVLNAWIYPNGYGENVFGGTAPASAIQNSDPSAPIASVIGAYFLEGPNSPNAVVDEDRVGSTFASVTPTPEPSTWALMGAAAIFFAWFPRNKITKRS